MLGVLLGLVLFQATVNAGAVTTTLLVKEPIFDGHLRIRLLHDPDWVAVPPAAGSLFLVVADSASGRDAFFVASDVAFEIGSNLIYAVEAEQASDLLGQALGGRLRPGETQLGFVMVPPAVDLSPFLPDHPE